MCGADNVVSGGYGHTERVRVTAGATKWGGGVTSLWGGLEIIMENPTNDTFMTTGIICNLHSEVKKYQRSPL